MNNEMTGYHTSFNKNDSTWRAFLIETTNGTDVVRWLGKRFPTEAQAKADAVHHHLFENNGKLTFTELP